jgi:hypothetical protein
MSTTVSRSGLVDSTLRVQHLFFPMAAAEKQGTGNLDSLKSKEAFSKRHVHAYLVSLPTLRIARNRVTAGFCMI